MRLRERLWPGLRRRGVVLEVVLALLSLGSIAVSAEDAGPLPPEILTVVAVLLAGLLLLRRRRAPLAVFLVSALGAAISPALNAALIISAYAVGRYEGRGRQRIAAAVVGMIAVVRPWAPQSLLEMAVLLAAAALLLLLPGVIGAWVRAREELVVALRDRAEKAETERELLARDAVLTERTRIAREMHDVVGHRVSLMVLQAGAIEMAARDADRVALLAGNVQDAGRQALDELRQMVGVLRGNEVDDDAPLGPQPGLDDVPRLVEEAQRAGMQVELRGELAPVDPAVGRATYRIVQEALTNAGKHAPGAPVTITLERAGEDLTVRVLNGAPVGDPAGASGGGYGLVGLAERVRTLGGRFTAGSRLDGGFFVEAVLPV
ncbi:sensor histidine kinase [Blastococcus xanthinilyticus]|uniref:histidine kinase n=1 Tax=Blastococcus xanthinilyticus TaxID=1564164 RepID=A0A5S5CU23_9ACTN|nr:histidine kinase [Blastococcus xanthinilyticus]TYP86584.1 MYXO-CTERM domain-containing protein [Blastococcus xanthinilyticus]